MKQLFITILLSMGLLYSHAQYQTNPAYGTINKRGTFDSTLFIPTGCGAPSGIASLKSVFRKQAAKYYDTCAGKEYTFNPKDSSWKETGGTSLYTQDVVINGPAGTKVGVLGNGDTIKAAGKTPDQVLQLIAVKAVAPTYVAPTVSVSGSPSPGNYERGTNLGTITLSRSFTQNDGGASSGDTYAKYISSWSNLGSNTDAITSLTQPVYYRVTTSYGQGPCKNNNVGQQDCTGRIQSGSVTSSNILYNPFDKRYWGFASSTAPSNSTILALSQDNNGSTGSLSLSNATPSGSQYFVYFTKGSVSSVTVNGFPATESFIITTYTVTNAVGFSSTYTYVYSNNPQTGTISSIVIN